MTAMSAMTGRFAAFFALACYLGVATAHAHVIVPPSGPAIRLDVGKGTLIELERNANTVFVADPAIADVRVKSPRLIYLYGKSPGETSLYAVDGGQNVMLNRQVVVQRDLGRLRAALRELIPAGVIKVMSVDDSIVLTGEVNSSVAAKEARNLGLSFVSNASQLIDRIDVNAPNQVNLRVRVAEVDHSVIKELGINWNALTYPGSFAFGIASGLPVVGAAGTSGVIPQLPSLVHALTTNPVTNTVPLGLAGSGAGLLSSLSPLGPKVDLPGFITRNAGAGGTSTDSGMLGINTGRININSVIDALNQNGLVHILAQPNLTAMSGQTASFLAGGEFPILVPSGPQQVTVQFKKFGVSLAFTPVVLNDGRISLRVRPEVSQISNTGAVQIQGYTIPALSTRRAETTVELGSGQTFAIGGLLQSNIVDTIDKVPGLGDLPILGALFRSNQFQNDESELVILVTPYLVRPVSAPKLAAPTDGYVPPNNYDLFARGRNERPPTSAAPAAVTGPNGGSFVGPAGFVLN